MTRKNYKVAVTLRLEIETRKMLEIIARDECSRATLSAAIRLLLREGIARRRNAFGVLRKKGVRQ